MLFRSLPAPVVQTPGPAPTPSPVVPAAVPHENFATIPAAPPQGETSNVPPQPGGARLIEMQEHDLIKRTLIAQQGRIRRTAEELGITHQALLRRLEKWRDLRDLADSFGTSRKPRASATETAA